VLHNLNLKQKLMLIILLPLLGVLILSAGILHNKYKISGEMQSIHKLIELSTSLGAVVHELQKERGRTSIYLSSKKEKQALDIQRESTNLQIQNLNQFFAKQFAIKKQTGLLQNNLTTIVQLFKQLQILRVQINQQQTEIKNAIHFYSSLNKKIITTIGILSEISTNSVITNRITNYIYILWAKENAGIERAVVAKLLAQKKISIKERKLLYSLQATQQVYFDNFLPHATIDEKEFYQAKLANEHLATFLSIRRELENNQFVTKPNTWFDYSTKRINYLNGLEGLLLSKLQAIEKKKMSSAQQSLVVQSIILLILIAVSISLALLFTKTITQSIQTTVVALQNIAEGDADLTQRIQIKSKDEIGDMAHWFNQFTASLQTLVQEITANATELSSSSHQLSGTTLSVEQATDEISHSIEQEASALMQTTATIQEMATSNQEITQQVQDIREKANLAEKDAAHGSEAMVKTIASMDKIAESSTQISGIVSVITEIAGQTNLLSLNAAIEAAKAGDLGKGFAVVAEEVRALAERSGSAVSEIQKLVESSNTNVQEGSVVIQSTNSSLSRIITQVQDISLMVNEVADSMRIQDQAIQEISGAADELASLSEKNSIASTQIQNTVREVSEATSVVEGAASSLFEQVNRFTV
jgi:methyl-accepting chemotaxis protein